jgi:hypothetical protein
MRSGRRSEVPLTQLALQLRKLGFLLEEADLSNEFAFVVLVWLAEVGPGEAEAGRRPVSSSPNPPSVPTPGTG